MAPPFILLLLLATTAAPALANPFFRCLPGIQDSPGVSLPRGDIKVEAGSEPFPIYCHLNPEHRYYKVDGLSSEQLGFYANNAELPSSIVNKTTIRALFNPEDATETVISCKVRSLDGSRNTGVCMQKVMAGFQPQPPTNFTCISDNWESLNCSWNQPDNPVPTSYSVVFKEPGKYKPFSQCPNKTQVEGLLSRKLPRDWRTCYLNQETNPIYRQPVTTFYFYVNATNFLNKSGNISVFIVEHYAIVRPGPAINLELTSSSPSKLQLNYDISNTMHHFHPGVYQAVRYKNDHDEEWKYITTTHLDITQEQFTIHLKDLPYAWTNYTVEVKMISGLEDLAELDPFNVYHISGTNVCKVYQKLDPRSRSKDSQKCIQNQPLWSDPVVISGTTQSSIPPHAPKTHPGSFEVVGGLEERSVLVYWQKLPPTLFNGPGFEYAVTEVVEDGKVVPIIPNHVANAYAKFNALSLNNYTVFVTAKNDLGNAPSTSKVFVAASDLLKDIMPKSFTKIDKSGREFEVAWRPPKLAHLVTSYTVFWCKAEDNRDRPYQCDGRLDWKEVKIDQSSNTLNKTFIANLTLPTDDIYQMAVAANTVDFSSGLVWATCTIIQNRVVSKLKNVKVFDIQTTKAHISWQLDCSDRVGIVTGYQVEYCPVATNDQKEKCLPNKKRTLNITGEAVNAKIENLTPWTFYKIGVRVITIGGIGEISDTSINQTKSARPGSPPKDLRIHEIDAKFAKLSWEVPLKPNGPIDHYEVAYWYRSSSGVNVTKKLNVINESIELQHLYSYTEYTVRVRACTALANKRTECGDEWTETPLVTPIGPPGQMKQPKVVFLNATKVQVSWDDKFQVGAPSVEEWELRIARNGTSLDWHKTFSPQVMSAEIDLDHVHEDKEWSPDCLNNSNTNIFNFSMRAKVKNDKNVPFTGPFSEDFSVAAYCEPAYPWMLIILGSVLLPIVVVAAVIALLRFWNWFQRKREFFKKLNRDIDMMAGQEFVIAANPAMGKGQNQGFTNVYATKKTEDKNKAYNRGGSRDSMETLLMGKELDKQHHTSGSSHNTSTPGSESGDGGERRRTDSENTSGSVEEKEMDTTATSDDTTLEMEMEKARGGFQAGYVMTGPTGMVSNHHSYVKQESIPGGVQNYLKGDVPGMVMPHMSNNENSSSSIEMCDYPDPTLPPHHPTAGYVPMVPRDLKQTSVDHYSRFSSSDECKLAPVSSSQPLPCEGYSRVGTLLDPIGLNDLRQRVVKPPVRGVMAGEDVVSNKNNVGPPNAEYVAFSSIKPTPQQAKSTSPGYYTINQLDQLNWN